MLHMRNIFVTCVFCAFFGAFQGLYAQSLDPTVEVTREYEGKLVETHKPSLEMSVPDSVTHFALDFDYSVFENPYKGSYDFNPYLLSMKPSATDMGEKELYLKAGAGYQLHPELDFVWSPDFKDPGLNVDVYALHRSFVGRYWKIEPDLSHGGKAYLMDRMPKGSSDRTWAGHDLLTRAGADLRYDSKGVAVDFGAGYYGLAQKDRWWKRGFNALDARFGLSTKPKTSESMALDIDAVYRLAGDRMAGTDGLSEQVLDFGISMGPIVKGAHKFLLDLGLDMAHYSKSLNASAAGISVVPHYIYRTDRLHLDAGLRIVKILRGPDNGKLYATEGQLLYPDVTFHYIVIPSAMRFYATAGGGNTIDTYSSILETNHHMNYMAASLPLDCTLERISLTAGLDGRISSKFSYNLRGGYVNYGNALLDAVLMRRTDLVEKTTEAVPTYEYKPYNKWFVAMDCCFKIEEFLFDASVSYNHAWGKVFEGFHNEAVLRPARLTGDVALEYNWRRRIFVGADCSFSTARKGEWSMKGANEEEILGYTMTLPGYADLGVYAEYVTSGLLSYWLRAGNLLNMTIQRNPLYAEKGIYFTVGISLSL